jgi:hypothetical protein
MRSMPSLVTVPTGGIKIVERGMSGEVGTPPM